MGCIINMSKEFEDIIKSVLADERLFKTINGVEKLFCETKWCQLREYYYNNRLDDFKDTINKRKSCIEQIKLSLEQEKSKLRYNYKKLSENYEELISKADSLIRACEHNQILLECVLQKLSWYGIAFCPLQNKITNDIANVIEHYGVEKAEGFIITKINKADKKDTKVALKAVYEYMKRLSSINENRRTIAYFIKNIPSLKVYWEVLDNEK